MIRLNINPKRIKAGDCVIRAIAYATDKTWEEVYEALCKIGFKMKRLPNEKQVYEKYLEQLGWTKYKQPKETNYENGSATGMKKYTVDELCRKLAADNLRLGLGKVIVSMAGHISCLECNSSSEYEIVDTWNCGYKSVGNYWIKQ